MASGTTTRCLFVSFYQSWMNFDLPKLQKELDITAADLADGQDKTEASRKKLVELSRDFKRTASQEVMRCVIPLLKSFQREIDALVKRSKLSETAFLSLYQKLINIPDPSSLLKAMNWKEVTPDTEVHSVQTPTEEEDGPGNQRRLDLMTLGTDDQTETDELQNPSPEQRSSSSRHDDLEEEVSEEKEPHHQVSFAQLAKRLSEAEQHTIALQAALDSTKSELIEMSAKYEEAILKVDRTEQQSMRPSQWSSRDFHRILEMIEDKFRDRTDLEEIKSIVSDALSLCIEKKDYLGVQCLHIKSRCDSGGFESQRDSLADTCLSRQHSTPDDVTDGGCVQEICHSQCSSVCTRADSVHSSQALEQCKSQAKSFLESTSSSSGSLDLDNHYLFSRSSPSRIPSLRNHPHSSLQGPLCQMTAASISQGTLDLLTPEAISIQKMTKTENLVTNSLDTADVSQRIREILSAHNIGQRLFARHVLGLSQGTVSELLSKPKHWDKLTEKGRESYRRMHAWSSDDANIMSLKAYVPKKGTNIILSNYEQDDAATEERIAQILCEAQAAMRMKQTEAKGEAASTMVANIYQQELAKLTHSEPDTSNAICPSEKPTYKAGIRGQGRNVNNGEITRGRRPHTDGEHLTRDIVTRIYQEELLKLTAAAETSGNVDELNVYRRELERLSSSSSSMELLHLNAAGKKERNICDSNDFHMPIKMEELSFDGHSTEDETASERELISASDFPQDLRVRKDGGGSILLRRGGSAFTLVRPRSARQQSESPKYLSAQTSLNADFSPLQQMQSIANSLLTKSQRTLRAILPPITQEQINIYSNINTDELVRKVKEMLSQYSISQRLFGESVLGLSQGSVSDLLARPKPWYMLTQKGREPFIRMQIFLEDEEAITKLVVTQFQIPPEKFLRCSFSDSMTPGIPLDSSVSGSLHQSSSPVSVSGANNYINSSSSSSSSSSASNDCCTLLMGQNLRPLSQPPASSPVSGIASGSTADLRATLKVTNHSVDTFLDHSPTKSASASINRNFDRSPLEIHGADRIGDAQISLGVQSAMAMILPAAFSFAPSYFHPSMLFGLQQCFRQNSAEIPSPSPGFDVGTAVPPQEIDTLEITTKVKEVLQFHNLGQKLFGEAVLGLSQGSVSELLSKPKPWQLLSLKGKEPFFKMHLWLMDPMSIEHLKKFQDQLRAHKRKASTEDQPTEIQVSHKKPRVFFSDEQKMSLRQAYATDPYPNQSTLDELAKDLGVGTKTVVNWFHNHRMRAKHHQGLAETSQAPEDSLTDTNTLYSSRADGHDELSNQSYDDAASTVSEREHLEFFKSGSAHESEMALELGAVHEYQPFNRPFPACETGPPQDGRPQSSGLGDLDKDPDDTTAEAAVETSCSNSKLNLLSTKSGVKTTQQLFTGDSPDASQPTTVEIPRKETEKHSVVVNKRKSAKPQWVFEGTVLDRSNHCPLKNGYGTVITSRSTTASPGVPSRQLRAESCVTNGDAYFPETVRGISICNGKS